MASSKKMAIEPNTSKVMMTVRAISIGPNARVERGQTPVRQRPGPRGRNVASSPGSKLLYQVENYLA